MADRRANNGGHPGSGRKKGARNKRTQATIDKAQAGGSMPLDILLKQMRHYDAAADRLAAMPGADKAEIRELERLAADRASSAAPYLHPKLQSLTHKGNLLDLSGLSEEQLRLALQLLESIGGPQPGGDQNRA
jgi:hypothetical protein